MYIVLSSTVLTETSYHSSFAQGTSPHAPSVWWHANCFHIFFSFLAASPISLLYEDVYGRTVTFLVLSGACRSLRDDD